MVIPGKWEGTFGPFSKLETLQFSIKCDPDIYYSYAYFGYFNGRISICRGNQPYILKADETFRGEPLKMSYKVTAEDLK